MLTLPVPCVEQDSMNRLSLVLVGTMAMLAEPAYSAASMRCGNELVSVGDHLVEVLGKCGEPVYAERRMGYHVRRVDGKYRRKRGKPMCLCAWKRGCTTSARTVS